MKTQKYLTWISIIALGVFTLCISCSKDEGGTSEPPPIVNGEGEIAIESGISADDLVTYRGDIGIVVDVREIQRKGYVPKKIDINVNANSGGFSQSLELNAYTLLAQLKLPVEDLNTATYDELREGVRVVVRVLDNSDNLIVEETISKISFQANPLPYSIRSNELEDLNTQFKLKSNTPYYIQIMENGMPTSKAIFSNPDLGGGYPVSSFIQGVRGGVGFTGDDDEAAFHYTFEAIPGTENTYAIKNVANNRYLRINRNWSPASVGIDAVVADLNWTFPDDFITGNTDARFVIKQNDDGSYRLESVQGEPIQVGCCEEFLIFLMINYRDPVDISFRFVPMNIEWSIENIGTEYMDPILPSAKNGFSFNNTLINCGQGGLSQTVGVSKTVETITTVGWEETLSVSSSHSAGGSLTLGMEVSASFFGNGATYSAEATAEYNYTTTSTTDTTNWNEATGSTSETFFSERTITVPPNSASLVYDAFQSYENIKVNVVQRLRVRANEFDTNESLSGEEIKTQFHFNGFKGVITEVGSDFIEVTLRGVATMDRVFKSKSEVRDVAANCGG